MATDPAPAVPPARTGSPTWGRAILAGQVVTLSLAVVTLGASAYRLTTFAAGPSDHYEAPEPPPAGAKPDEVMRYNVAVSSGYTRHAMRTQERGQERAVVSTSAGLLVGVALAFVGIALSLTAAGAELAAADAPATVAARVVRWVPGAVALVSAAVVTAAWAPESKPASGGGAGYPSTQFVQPQAVPFAPSAFVQP